MTQTSELTAAVADIHDRLVRLRELDQRELELLGRIVEALKALRRDLDTLERLVS
jgi:predicted AAA+ superfamily ATPase